MTIKKSFFVAFFLSLFLAPFLSSADTLNGDIFSCVCSATLKSSHTQAGIGGGCTTEIGKCDELCQQYFNSATMFKLVASEEKCITTACASGKKKSYGEEITFASCQGCQEAQINIGSNLVSCTDNYPDGSSASSVTQEFANPPDVTLEVPFGSTNNVNDISEYISVFYSFIVPLIAIAAVIMIMFGGFKYATAAGNSAMVSSAKKTITNAIIGLVLALASYLLLYTINPELVSLDSLKIPFVQLIDDSASSKGSCPDAPADSACSVDKIKSYAGDGFGEDLEKMSRVCWRESGGKADLNSGVDVCQDGKAFSFGFYQINMVVNGGSVPDMDCKNIFEPATSLGSCVKYKDANNNGVREKTEMCLIWSCKVVDQAKYDKCSQYLKTPDGNTKTAVVLYKKAKLQPWTAPWACTP